MQSPSFAFCTHAPERAERRAQRRVALVDLGVGVAELDRDVALELVLEANRLRTG